MPFIPIDKCTGMTYTSLDGKMHRVIKDALEQILEFAHRKEVLNVKEQKIMNCFANRGLRSLELVNKFVYKILY